MKRAFLALVALPLLAGCITSPGWIQHALGIKPDGMDYGPIPNSRMAVWEAAREVLADEGYTFKTIDREEWEIETHWYGYGADQRYHNYRYRVSIELDETREGVMMELLVEEERNSGTNPLDPELDDWEHQGANEEMEDQLAFMIQKALNGKKDVYEEAYKRLEEQENRKRTPPPDYADPNR
jgi:uncharacterized lipoprotein